VDYWEANNIEKPTPVVVCAACKYNDLILCSARHWDKVMNIQLRQIRMINEKVKAHHFIEGFINQFGEFLTREDAYIVAENAGQKIDLDGCGGMPGTLFSEGLY
jgi:hypothetical protein